MITLLLQFTVTDSASAFGPQNSVLNSNLLFGIFVGIIILVALFVALFITKTILTHVFKTKKAFDRILIRVMVPKEKKSEGSGTSNEDRLEQIKEEIGITEALFATVAGLKAERGIMSWLKGRNDHLSFELVVHNSLIYFYIAVPHRLQNFLEQQIHAQYPYAQIDVMTDYNIFSENSSIMGAYLISKKTNVFPFKSYKKMDSDPMSGILNALSRIRENNASASIQFVLRSAKRSWRRRGVQIVREVKKGEKFENVAGKGAVSKVLSTAGKTTAELFSTKSEEQKKDTYQLSSMEEEMLKGIEEKLSKGGLDLTVRIISVSDNEEVSKLNLENIVNAFSQYNLYRYGNEFQAIIPRNQKTIIRDFIYRSFHESRALLVNTEEIASLWHLPLHSTEAPNIKWLSGRTAPPPVDIPKDGLLLGHVEYRGTDTPIRLGEADRRRHLYVIGKSGSGKSVTLANLAIQDIKEGKGICIVDPHGDLVEDVLAHIPKHRADDVVIFNPSDLDRPIGLNMLEPKDEDQKDFAVQEMISIFYKLFPPEMIGPMFEHNMRNVMLTLMADIDNPGTVIDIPRMFTDDTYVKEYLKKVTDPVVRAFWEKEMAKTSDFHKSEMLGYLVSKVGRFVGNEMMRNIMGQQKSGFDFREIMDNQKILLVNLAKGKTGEINAKLLGLIVVAKLQMAAMGRADMNQEDRKDFYLYIDEFQNFITDSISTILSEARKYKLDLILAHQYMGQLTDDKGRSDVRDAVLGNAGTIMVGRIGPDDAEILQKEFAPNFGSYDLLNPPEYSFYTKMLIEGKASKPFNMKAYPPQEGNQELADAIKQLSRLKYGRDKRIVETEILDRTKIGEASEGAKTDSVEATL